MFDVNTTPSSELLKAVRAALIFQGSSLSRWAFDNGVKRQNITKALVGDWKGPKAAQLIERVLADADLERRKCWCSSPN